MAKKRSKKVRTHYRAGNHGKTRKLNLHAEVEPAGYGGAKSFQACITTSSGKGRARLGRTTECAFGKNPRKALGNAMRRAAQSLSKRGGAFAGVK